MFYVYKIEECQYISAEKTFRILGKKVCHMLLKTLKSVVRFLNPWNYDTSAVPVLQSLQEGTI